MQEQFRPLDPADYPDTLTFSGQKFRLRYRFAPGEEPETSRSGIWIRRPIRRMDGG